ncbi:MAG: hypothetical protein QM779_05935 [Propionicimonas sp.]
MAGIGASLGASAAQAAEGDAVADPLTVTIDGLDPAVIPAKGPLRVTGTITNASDSDWSDLQAYLVISPNPLRTRAELDDAAGSAPDTYFGDRLAGEGQYDDAITDLKPGQSTRFDLTVRRKDLDERILSRRSGVYQLGIQVLGAEDGVRTDGADGRARTFITLMPKKNPPTTALGVLVQVRAPVSYDSTGRPLSPDRWNQLLSADGRLGRLLSLTTDGPVRGPGVDPGGGAGGGRGGNPGFPFSYLIDPAVPDLAHELAAGSPGYDLSLGRTESDPSESPSPSESPGTSSGTDSDSGSSGDSGSGTDDTTGDTTDDTTTTAAAWLKLLDTGASNHGVLAVPYGDVDVEAAYQAHFGPLVEHATRHGIDRLNALGIAASPVIAPTDGSLTQSTSKATAALGPQLLGASQVDVRDTRVDTTAGAHLTVADDVFSAPDTTVDRTALGVRQRVIAEAAVHALGSRAEQPLIVTLPSRWDPGAQWERSHFFEALAQVPWLTGTPVSEAVRSPLADSVADPAVLPQNPPDKSALIPIGNFTEASTLQRVAGTLDATLDRSGALTGQFDAYAYLATSAQYRKAPLRVTARDRCHHRGGTRRARQGVGAWAVVRDHVERRGPLPSDADQRPRRGRRGRRACGLQLRQAHHRRRRAGPGRAGSASHRHDACNVQWNRRLAGHPQDRQRRRRNHRRARVDAAAFQSRQPVHLGGHRRRHPRAGDRDRDPYAGQGPRPVRAPPRPGPAHRRPGSRRPGSRLGNRQCRGGSDRRRDTG